MDALLRDLLACLDLEQKDDDHFRGPCEGGRRHGRIFGGQVLAQALMAAGRTVPDRPAHSLQALFLAMGDPTAEIDFDVERLRDGRSFAARRVMARQGERAILSMQVSFHATEPGYEHQMPAPKVPAPETLLPFAELAEKMRPHFAPQSAGWADQPRPLEVRFSEPPSYMGGQPLREPCGMWFRAEAALPDDALLHQSLLAYASDIAFNDSAHRPHAGPEEPALQAMASVDHSMWFHVPARVDDWLLHYHESPRAALARGHSRGSMFTRDGVLVASTGQDSLIRPAPPGTEPKPIE